MRKFAANCRMNKMQKASIAVRDTAIILITNIEHTPIDLKPLSLPMHNQYRSDICVHETPDCNLIPVNYRQPKDFIPKNKVLLNVLLA